MLERECSLWCFGCLSTFYVGCSRARKNLAIVINNADVVAFEERLKNKFKDIGFEIEEI